MRSILLVAGLVPACTIPNPAFDVPSTVSDPVTATGSSSAPATTSPTSDGETSETGETSAALTTTVDPGSSTTGDATSAVSTAITVSTGDTTADTAGDTGDTTTGEPASCWAQGAANWPPDGAPLNDFEDTKPRDPFISPDGLQLYYIAGEPPRVFVSTRLTPGEAFLNGVQLVLWGNDPAITPGYPRVVLADKELLFSSKFDVYSAKAADDQPFDKYALPVPLTPPSTAGAETVITVTADSTTLIVNRQDGPPIGLLPKSFRFYQYARPQPVPGAPYAGGQDVTPVVLPLKLALCPTLSPDGLHLFFGSTTSDTLTEANANDVVGIFYTSRPDPLAPWAEPEPLAIAHAGQGITCPSSVTADGCQLAFHRFFLNQDDYSMHLAVRAP